jgi:hypothetical protein
MFRVSSHQRLKIIGILSFLATVVLLLSLYACEEEQKPTVTTGSVTNITSTSVSTGGDVVDDGSEPIIARGVCWSTKASPTIDDNKTIDGAEVGPFTSHIEGLNGATTYVIRAYALNSVGVGYGESISFTTLGELPIVQTLEATSVQKNSATLNATVNPGSLSTEVYFEFGTTSDYGSRVEISNSPLEGNSTVTLSGSVANLTPGNTYHFRIVAVNQIGTTFGDDLSFKTPGGTPPTVSTSVASSTTPTSAVLNGSVEPHNLETTVTFEYGLTNSYGNSIAIPQNPIIGDSSFVVHAEVDGLTKGQTYHYRIVATNAAGVSYGEDLTFTTAYRIGDFLHGGYIFYIDDTGEHGMVAAPDDFAQLAQWGCTYTLINGSNGSDIGSGLQNTLDILQECTTQGIAARKCADLVTDGLDDWFLPSIAELKLMHSNLYLNNFGNFSAENYWSSTQDTDYSALTINFYYSNSTNTRFKNLEFRVRAVREF